VSNIDVTALVTAVAGLITAFTALLRVLKGEQAHSENVERLMSHAERLKKLESNGGTPPPPS
jgi:hypothetical protein